MQTTNEKQPGAGGDLNHPRREEWMDLLYGEISRADKARLTAHLADCAQCRGEVNTWQSAMSALDQNPLPKQRAPWRWPEPSLKWGIAAALILLAGFGVGRLTSPAGTDLRASRAELLADLRQEQIQQLANYKISEEDKRMQDYQVIFTALQKIETARVADSLVLHKELETVAVNTQDSFQQTHQQIATLASYTEPNLKSVNP